MTGRRFVILDRDGTLIVKRHYLRDPAQVELLPGAAAALGSLAAMGLGLVVVTNQSGIARGYLDRDDLEGIHQRLTALLSAHGVVLDGVYHCPHHPDDACACRKPGTAMAAKAGRDLGFTPGEGFVIGDDACDVGLGRNLGATTILVRTGRGMGVELCGEAHADYHVDDLSAAVGVISQLLARTSGATGSLPASALDLRCSRDLGVSVDQDTGRQAASGTALLPDSSRIRLTPSVTPLVAPAA